MDLMFIETKTYLFIIGAMLMITHTHPRECPARTPDSYSLFPIIIWTASVNKGKNAGIKCGINRAEFFFNNSVWLK